MNTPIDLRRAQHAVWLAQELNFSRAAQRAHLSQTAFSRSIQALEASLGLQLFDRGTRHVAVTAAGVQWLEQASTALAQARQLGALARDLASGDGGELVIGATPLAVDSGLAQALTQLRLRRPRLRVEVVSGPWQRLRELLQADRLELFVGFPGDSADQLGCTVRALATQATSVYVRADHPLAGVPVCTLAQMLAYPWACVQMHASLQAGLRQLVRGAELPLTLETDNQTLLRHAVLHTDTILLTWPQWLQADLAAGRVLDLGARLSPQPAPAMRQLACAVVHRSDRSLSPAAEQLVQLLVETQKQA